VDPAYWTWKRKLAALTIIWCAYLAIGEALHATFVPPPLGHYDQPIRARDTTGFDVFAPAPEYEELSDSLDRPTRSPLVIYENGKPLGPAHSLHIDIHKLGHGRFSHWTNVGFIFSSSDGTDPRTNGRTYRVVRADASPRDTIAMRGSENFDIGDRFAAVLKFFSAAVTNLSLAALYAVIKNAYQAPIEFAKLVMFVGFAGISGVLLTSSSKS
jgi:hypothetical protein